MDKKVYEKLINYVKTARFNTDKVLHELLRKYDDIEKFDIDNILDYIEDFFNFVCEDRVEQALSDNRSVRNYDVDKMLNEMHYIQVALGYFFDGLEQERQEGFASVVENCLPNSDCHILDVGSGCIPYSSIVLASHGYKVDAMDKFILSDDVIKSYGVNPKHGYFHKKVNTKPYSIVVGRKPCEAIASIATNCVKRYKPFIIDLCDCSLHKEHKKNGDSYTRWEDYMYDLDPKINIYDGFAYKLDNISNRYVEDVIDHYGHIGREPMLTDEEMLAELVATINGRFKDSKLSAFSDSILETNTNPMFFAEEEKGVE